MQQIILTVIIAAVVIVLLVLSIRIVPQANTYVVERLGRYHTTLQAGFHVIIPLVDRIAKKISMMEQVVDFAPQPVITKDNVTMRIDTVLYYRVTDPKLYAYGVNNPLIALENLTSTTLRNVIGEMELDETLTSRETINTNIRSAMEKATETWGIEITRVELKNITPPAAIQDAMEKQMKAERERREAILIAEGEKQSAILVAEGKKQSAILNAEGEKEAAILRAEAAKQATILRAEAAREASIREAEGHGKAIELIQESNAKGIEALNQKEPSEKVLRLKSLEAFAKAADGKATKIIIPAEIQSMAGLVTAARELAVSDAPAEGV
ncbi:MAG: SPFH/Band 7/PHB domain protein [Oscillospiraceae bacterium]|nr:SPFH/Band 7/PHB domain protein [Oscillospiraceae bacterium]MCD8343763.1 SPFH/Band 7/PHB domain protein [Oscillospiraceae bacterium]